MCYLQGLGQVIPSLRIYQIDYSSANVSRSANAHLLCWCLKALKLSNNIVTGNLIVLQDVLVTEICFNVLFTFVYHGTH